MSRFRSLALLAVGASSLTLPVLAIADRTAATSATEPAPGAVEILAPDELVGGATLGELSASWWQWAASQSEGFSCEQGQHGAVFFMPPQVERSWDCVVPEGIPIYVIVHGGVCSSNALPPHFGRNEEELQACVDSLPGTPPTTKVSVNGQDVADLDTYRVTSPMFTVFVSDDAGQLLPAGVSLAMSATAFVIAPPPPGEYVITVIDEGRVLGYTINVTVEAPQIIEPTETTEAPQASDAPDVTAVSTPHSMTTTPRSADGDAATTPPQESDSFPSGPVSSVSATSLGSSSTPDELWVEGGTPPSVVLRTGSETVSVAPHSYCGQGFCADGPTIPPDGPAVVIEGPEVVIEYPLANWSFAVLSASGSGVMLEPLEPGRWRLVSTTPGRYEIVLDGHGDDPRFGATFVFGWIVEPE